MSAAPRGGAVFFCARAGDRGGGAVARANGGGVAPGGRAHVALRRLQGREQRTDLILARLDSDLGASLGPFSPRNRPQRASERRKCAATTSARTTTACSAPASNRPPIAPSAPAAAASPRSARRPDSESGGGGDGAPTNRGGGGGGGGGEGGAVHARFLEIREQRIRLSSALRTASQPLPLSCQLPHRSHDPLILLVDDAAALPRVLLLLHLVDGDGPRVAAGR